MFTGRSTLFSFVVLSCLASARAAVNDTATAAAPPATPPGVPATGCAALCTQAKLQDGARWYGQSEVHVYCQHPEFIKAFQNCLHDNCKPDELESAQQVGETLCAGVQPVPANAAGPKTNGTNTAPVDPNNPTANRPPLSGPATAPSTDVNTTVTPGKGINPGSPVTSLTGTGTNTTGGALNGTLTSPTLANNATSGTNRFPGPTGSAAANASAQANSARSISPSSALALTVTSFMLSMIL